MKVDVCLYPKFEIASNFNGQNVVVLDVLRATSCMVTALAKGAIEIIPVAEPAEVMKLMRQFGAEDCLTGGEQNGFKIEGFDLGNSPLEYTKKQVAKKKIILCTSNGTRTVKWVQHAARILIGSFLNIEAIVKRLLSEGRDTVIVCAGRERGMGLDDLVCAGMIVTLLTKGASDNPLELTDAAKLAQILSDRAEAEGLESFIRSTEHGKKLEQNGMGNDIAECIKFNQHGIVPEYENGRVIIKK